MIYVTWRVSVIKLDQERYQDVTIQYPTGKDNFDRNDELDAVDKAQDLVDATWNDTGWVAFSAVRLDD